MIIDDLFHRRLAYYRGRQNLSQGDLAKLAGIAPAQLSRYESGKTKPRAEIVAKLADALGVSLTFLTSGSSHLRPRALTESRVEEEEEGGIRVLIPPSLAEKIEASATENNRTITAETVARLQSTFSSPETAGTSFAKPVITSNWDDLIDLLTEEMFRRQSVAAGKMKIEIPNAEAEVASGKADDPKRRLKFRTKKDDHE